MVKSLSGTYDGCMFTTQAQNLTQANTMWYVCPSYESHLAKY